MIRRSAAAAFREYVELLHQVLGCVTTERLEVGIRGRLLPNVPIALSISDLEPVPLRGMSAMDLAAAQVVRIDDEGRPSTRGAFRIETIQYFYRFSYAEGREILSFHWTPNAIGNTSVTFPHLHIGRAITGGRSEIRPRDIHKAHIPTGYVSLPAVVRLAIAEFGVTPLRANWEEILRRTEAILDQVASPTG